MEMEIENVKFCSITFINFMAISIAFILLPPHSLFIGWHHNNNNNNKSNNYPNSENVI